MGIDTPSPEEQYANWKPDERRLKELPKEERGFSQDEFLKDLRAVGPDKPMGYLPLPTITELAGKTIQAMEDEARSRGLKTIIIPDGRMTARGEIRSMSVAGGALYVYHEEALTALLARHAPVLQKEGWPTTSEAFVHEVGNRLGTGVVADIIKEAFGRK